MTESDSINSLQLASQDPDVDVDDAIITISGHCTKLDYYRYTAHMRIT